MIENTKTINERVSKLEKLLLTLKIVLDIEEASIYTSRKISYLYQLTCQRKIPHSKRGKILYFSRLELDQWMLKNRIKTIEELEQEAANYQLKK